MRRFKGPMLFDHLAEAYGMKTSLRTLPLQHLKHFDVEFGL
jgi:hypothetical protein